MSDSGSSDPDASDQGRLAKDRTDLAEDRTLLAHERSFAGWVRTGMACVAVGLGFHVLFEPVSPTWVPKMIATLFLALAIFIFLSASGRACRVLSRLSSHRVAELKPIRIRALSWALSGGTMALAAAIWLLAPG